MISVSPTLTARRVASKVKARVRHMLLLDRNHVIYQGSVLPAPDLRFNGPDQRDNAFYLQSAEQEADRVIRKLGYTPDSLLVDIGCGQGRLAIGLARRLPAARYLGLDVSERSILWCREHLESRYPSYRFRHLNLVNARYNPAGDPLPADFRLPVADGAAAVAYLWGVVTNMEPEFLGVYAQEIGRILQPGGRLFLTANVEDDVPEVSINPENYTSFQCHGPLNIVRHERRYFLDVFRQAGLTLTDYAHHAAGNCQSDLYFVRECTAPRSPSAAGTGD